MANLLVKAVASWLLLALDYALRVIQSLWRSIQPILPSMARLGAIGALAGGAVVGGGIVVVKYGTLVTEPGSWARVGFVWGVALVLWAIAGMMYMILKTSATMLAGIIYKLTDIGNRPIVVQEPYRSTLGDLGEPGGGARQPKPTFRDPGNLGAESSFVPYSDEDAAVKESVRAMRAGGIDEESIQEILAEFEKQK